MEWAALIAWIVTAGFGFIMLAGFLRRGGMQQREAGRIKPPLLLSHFLLAAGGLVLWIIYVATDSDALAWIAFVAIAVVAVLGWTMFAVWARQRSMRPAAAPTEGGSAPGAAPMMGGPGGEPAEQGFPVPVVALHGLAAVTTVVLVFLTAIGVGGS